MKITVSAVYNCVPPCPPYSLPCRLKVWTDSCGRPWTWSWTCRCLGRGRPGWRRSFGCYGSWRRSWRRRGSRARESCRPGSKKTNASGSSLNKPRNRWVTVHLLRFSLLCLGEFAWTTLCILVIFRLVRSSCRRNEWRRWWGQQRRTSTRSGARAERRSPRSRPSGGRDNRQGAPEYPFVNGLGYLELTG